jgi:hypothetical protein
VGHGAVCLSQMLDALSCAQLRSVALSCAQLRSVAMMLLLQLLQPLLLPLQPPLLLL